MSSISDIHIRSMINEAIAKVVGSGFLDQGFINTMRFSELNGDEEYDNTVLYIAWHFLAEGGMQQVRQQAADLRRLKTDPVQWNKLDAGEKERVEDIITRENAYDYSKPVDDKKNIWTMRNKIADINENVMDSIMFYDGHTAILNGRMARAKGHKKDLIDLSKNANANEKDIQVGDGEKKHFWNRGNGE